MARVETATVAPSEIQDGNVLVLANGREYLVTQSADFSRSEGSYVVKVDDGTPFGMWMTLEDSSYFVKVLTDYMAV